MSEHDIEAVERLVGNAAVADGARMIITETPGKVDAVVAPAHVAFVLAAAMLRCSFCDGHGAEGVTLDLLLQTYGVRAVEHAAWGVARGLDAEARQVMEAALALGGVDELEELLLAGPALGGVGAEVLDAMRAALARV